MQAGHATAGKPVGTLRKNFNVSGQELTLSVGRFVVVVALGASVLVTGVGVREAFWPMLAVCLIVSGGELAASIRSPRWSPSRLLLARDVVVVLVLVALAAGMASFAGQALLLVVLSEAAFLLKPRAVAVFAPAVYAAMMLVSVIPGVQNPDIEERVFALWTAVMVVVIAARVAGRDSALVAMTASRGRLLADAEVAEQRERARLAEALHDDALQRIFAVRQDLDEAVGSADRDRLIEKAGQGLSEAVDSLRALTKAMHGQRLADAGLRRAVQRLADDAARRAHFEAVVDVDDDAGSDFDEIVVGFIRELVNNVEKHAGAERMEVSVRRGADELVVEVIDDGIGMNLERLGLARADGHLGHATLRDRVETVGGDIDIVSSPGRGTSVRIVLGEERLRAQRALGEQLDYDRERGAALLAALQDGFVVVHEGRIVDANDRFCAMTGYSRDALLSLPAGSVPFWSAEGGRSFERLVERAQSDGEAAGEMTLLGAGGERRPVLLSARVARDARGEDVGTMIVFTDFEALHAGRERLRREHEIVDALVRDFPSALCVTAPGLGIVRVNERLCDLTGFTEAELLGSELPYPFVPEELVPEAAQRLATGGSFAMWLPLVRRDGTHVETRVSGTVLRGLDGRVLGQILVISSVAAAITAAGIDGDIDFLLERPV